MATDMERQRLPSGRHGLPKAYVVRNQRDRLMEAMVFVVCRKGYEGTTVADVIESAGVSRTTFYEMFRDKQDCFLASYDAVFDVLLHGVEHAYRTTKGEWPTRIRAGIGALVDLLAQESDIARMAMVEVTSAGPTARQRYRDGLNRFLPFLDEGRGSSEHANLLPATTSRLAIGAAATLIFDEVRAGRASEMRRLLPELVFAVLLPYLGPERASQEMQLEAKAVGAAPAT